MSQIKPARKARALLLFLVIWEKAAGARDPLPVRRRGELLRIHDLSLPWIPHINDLQVLFLPAEKNRSLIVRQMLSQIQSDDVLSSWAWNPLQPQRVSWSQWNEMLREQLTVLCELCVMSWVACGEPKGFHSYPGFSWCQTPPETWAWQRKRCQKGR